MNRRLAMIVLVAGLGLAAPAAAAACNFSGGEITNPFQAGCGDVVLTYNSGNIGNATTIALGYTVPVPVASLTPVAGFREYASLHARHQDLVLTTGSVRSTGVGTTISGRTVYAYAFGDVDGLVAGSTRAEPAIMINGTIHPREWQSPESVTEFMERLALNAADGGLYQYLAENLNIIVLPVMNVDGFLQTQAHPTQVTASASQPRDGRMRRKNLRNPNSATPVDGDLTTVADNFFGVDLNRNSDVGWGMNGASQSSTTSLVYRGPAPGTEPEILALRAAAALGPANRLRMYSDTHSFTRAFLVSSTNNTRLTGVTTALVAAMRAAGTSVNYSMALDAPGSDIGTTSDYFNATYEVPAWTLEIEPTDAADYGSSHGHAGFITPDSRITTVRDDIARMYVRGAYAMAGPPSVRRVVISGPGPTVVYDASWIGTGTTRSLQVATSVVLAAGTAYRVWVAFDKPMRTTGTGTNPTLELLTTGNGMLGALAPTGAQWHGVVAAEPNGASRYAFDAWSATVTLPAAIGGRSAFKISIDASDFAGQGLDSDPRTAVDWGSGHWTGYESTNGSAEDSGGIDRSYTLTGPGTGSGGGGGGGGGGATDALLLIGLALLTRSVRARRLRAA